MQHPAADSLHSGRPSVLVVEPDSDTRSLYHALLEGVASAVIDAEGAEEALRIAVEERPDVILTETRLFGITGYTLCSLLRRHDATRSAVIIVVTAAAQPVVIVRGAAAGADEVLVKPVLPEVLVAVIRRLWMRRRGRRRLAQESAGGGSLRGLSM